MTNYTNHGGYRMDSKRTANQLLAYIKEATSPFHAVKESVRMLEEAGFKELDMRTSFSIEKGGKYYVMPYGTTVFAFTV